MKITKKNKKYSKKLLEIEDPPEQLYYSGNLNLLNTTSIAIIGSRACTIKGKQIAKRFARELAVQGITIVSGMAKGIDRAAHEGALEVGGNTIAVLGNGLDNIFPEENKDIYEEICKNGLVITEYPNEIVANKETFPRRNRIVSGLSIGVLIIEAQYRSGTSITASLAKKQNREIFCIPHNIEDSHGIGTNRQIKYRGAILVTKIEDIFEQFNFLEYDKEKAKKLNIIKPKVNKKYQEVFDLIAYEPIESNEVCQKTGKPMSEVNMILSMLELQGYIRKQIGGYVWDTNKQ